MQPKLGLPRTGKLGWEGGWAGPRCSCEGARPDPHIPPSARINNDLNFFHLSRDSHTCKHREGKAIDSSQLLPSPPHHPHHPPCHLASPPPDPSLSIRSLSASLRIHSAKPWGHRRQGVVPGRCSPPRIHHQDPTELNPLPQNGTSLSSPWGTCTS